MTGAYVSASDNEDELDLLVAASRDEPSSTSSRSRRWLFVMIIGTLALVAVGAAVRSGLSTAASHGNEAMGGSDSLIQLNKEKKQEKEKKQIEQDEEGWQGGPDYSPCADSNKCGMLAAGCKAKHASAKEAAKLKWASVKAVCKGECAGIKWTKKQEVVLGGWSADKALDLAVERICKKYPDLKGLVDEVASFILTIAQKAEKLKIDIKADRCKLKCFGGIMREEAKKWFENHPSTVKCYEDVTVLWAAENLRNEIAMGSKVVAHAAKDVFEKVNAIKKGLGNALEDVQMEIETLEALAKEKTEALLTTIQLGMLAVEAHV